MREREIEGEGKKKRWAVMERRRNRRRGGKEEEGGCLAGRPPCEHTLTTTTTLPSFSLTQLATSIHLKRKADEDKTSLPPIPPCFSFFPPPPSPPHSPPPMDDPSSECSTGAESGWTLYLQHSLVATRRPTHLHNTTKLYHQQGEQEEEEEDLSMVSDASSGPPHLEEDDDSCFCPFPMKSFQTQNPISINQHQHQHHHHQQKQKQKQKKYCSVLDDTASSPASDYYPTRKKDNASSGQHQSMAAPAFSSANNFSSSKVIRR